MMRQAWWKILAFLLLMYTSIYGFFVKVPKLEDRMKESIRNYFFHVPMWFAMTVLMSVSIVYSIKYLRTNNPLNDHYASAFAAIGSLYGLLGTVTGAIWANYQWGQPWSGDVKQNGAAIALLIYFAYFVLRGSLNDEEKRARISAVYNIFAYCMLFPTLYILPRLTESLHPGGQGSEGNPALNPNDTTPEMLSVMFPAFIGWTILGIWIATIRIRLSLLTEKKLADA